jgi:NACalpha-BTF3-like transcription factor
MSSHENSINNLVKNTAQITENEQNRNILIEMIVNECGCSVETASKALNTCEGDLINAILMLKQ